jgi:hypothetical protein
MTGYSTYVSSRAGYITELTLTQKFPTTYWSGVYGLALRVSGFNEVFFKDFSGNILRQDLFFDCLQQDAPGGIEIYASTSPNVMFDFLEPAPISMIDSFLGCSDRYDCASNTFTDTYEHNARKQKHY